MTTNKAPKKIYVHIKDKPCEITFSEVIEKECSNIEYIRTDAFIKKAVSYIQQHWIWNTKMIEDFKNYIIKEKYEYNR